MERTALAGGAPAPALWSGRLWHAGSGVVLGWEAVAGASDVLHRRGVVGRRVPYVTDVVRALPGPGRIADTAVVCAAVVDHFGKRRFF